MPHIPSLEDFDPETLSLKTRILDSLPKIDWTRPIYMWGTDLLARFIGSSQVQGLDLRFVSPHPSGWCIERLSETSLYLNNYGFWVAGRGIAVVSNTPGRTPIGFTSTLEYVSSRSAERTES